MADVIRKRNLPNNPRKGRGPSDRENEQRCNNDNNSEAENLIVIVGKQIKSDISEEGKWQSE
jgi:hypothetical protein